MADVFISYSRKNGDFVRTLHHKLTSESRDIWVDWEDIPPSADWMADIERAIDGSDVFLLIISPYSLNSKTCCHEYEYAVNNNKRNFSISPGNEV